MSDSNSNTLINAMIGAVVTILFSFTIVSPVLGGAVAGYLERRDGIRVGAIAGLIAVVPLLFFWVLFMGFFTFGPLSFVFGLFLIGFVLMFVIAWTIGLSALGGYIGEYLHDEL